MELRLFWLLYVLGGWPTISTGNERTYSSLLSSIYTDRLNCTSNRIGRRTVRRMCDKPLAYRGDLAAVFEVCPLAKEIGYRQFCSRPEWQEAKEFQVWKDPVLGSVFRTCNVTNLASKVPDAYWCNGVYNCVDRADEAECETITTQDFPSIPDDVRLRLQTRQKVVEFEECELNDDQLAESDFTKGVSVGGKCFPPKELCGSNFYVPFDLVYHRQHLNVCRNKTFWADPRLKCEDDFDLGDRHCRGNTPGLCFRGPGCLEKFTDEMGSCWDGSDRIFCTKSVDCEVHGLFRCHDNQTCLPNRLVCDGYEQCGDGSDEKQDCANCGRGRYFPQVNESQPWTATYQCDHRYTGLPICATPCDGLDDLCSGNADEQCGFGVPFLIILACVAASVAIIISIAELVKKYRSYGDGEKDEAEEQESESETRQLKDLRISFQQLLTMTEDDYTRLRDTDDFGDRIYNAAQFCEHFGRLEDLRSISQKCYFVQKEKSEDGTEAAADRHFMETLGASDLTMLFYDAVDSGAIFGFKIRVLSGLPESALNAACRRGVHRAAAYGRACFTTCLYFADVVKDVLLIFHLQRRLFSQGVDSSDDLSFPLALFYVMVAAVSLTEICNLIVLSSSEYLAPFSWPKRIAAILLWPLFPGYAAYREAKIKLKTAELLHELKGTMMEGDSDNGTLEAALTEARHEFRHLRMLRARLRSNENSTEHFVQVALAAIVVLVDVSDTRAVPTLREVFLGDSLAVIVFSGLLSLFSLVRGHLFYTDARKNGHLPLVGKLILFVYFVLSMAARIFAIVLFFTPLLGLFGTLKYAQMATVSATMGYRKEGDAVHDINPETLEITYLNQTWGEFKLDSISDFCGSSTEMVATMLAVPAIVLALHITVTLYLSRKYPTGGDSCIPRYWEGLYTMVCPPAFKDWTEFYGRKSEQSILSCWQTSRRRLAHYLLLFALEHFLLCLPLMVLKYLVAERKASMVGMFAPLPAEEHSEIVTDAVLFSSLTVYLFVLPLCQFGLVTAYFKYGHCWSRVLKSELLKEKNGNKEAVELLEVREIKDIDK